MEKAYRNISYFFVAILIVAFIGFFQTYFIQFPTFNGSNNIQHFHAIMMLSWMAMLIIQPLLIKYKKIDWHRQLGKVSYFQVTLILASFFLIGRTGYLRDAVNLPQAENIGLLALTIPDMFGFSILYILAMVNKNRAAIHMRYIIGASLLMISLGLGRIAMNYTGASLPTSAEISHVSAIVVSIFLIIYDFTKHRPYKPFVVAFVVLSLMHLCWELRLTAFWQRFAGKFAETLF
jgi:hypothetical protein